MQRRRAPSSSADQVVMQASFISSHPLCFPLASCFLPAFASSQIFASAQLSVSSQIFANFFASSHKRTAREHGKCCFPSIPPVPVKRTLPAGSKSLSWTPYCIYNSTRFSLRVEAYIVHFIVHYVSTQRAKTDRFFSIVTNDGV